MADKRFFCRLVDTTRRTPLFLRPAEGAPSVFVGSPSTGARACEFPLRIREVGLKDDSHVTHTHTQKMNWGGDSFSVFLFTHRPTTRSLDRRVVLHSLCASNMAVASAALLTGMTPSAAEVTTMILSGAGTSVGRAARRSVHDCVPVTLWGGGDDVESVRNAIQRSGVEQDFEVFAALLKDLTSKCRPGKHPSIDVVMHHFEKAVLDLGGSLRSVSDAIASHESKWFSTWRKPRSLRGFLDTVRDAHDSCRRALQHLVCLRQLVTSV